MMSYTGNLKAYGNPQQSPGLQEIYAASDSASLGDIAREEHAAVSDLIEILREERKAIMSLSLKDITAMNTEKEKIIKSLGFLRERRNARIADLPDDSDERRDEEYLAMVRAIKAGMREATTYLRKNKILLTLSAGRIKAIMEFIARSLKSRQVTYGREASRGPAFFARRV